LQVRGNSQSSCSRPFGAPRNHEKFIIVGRVEVQDSSRDELFETGPGLFCRVDHTQLLQVGAL
jgi:hypothetical protein